MCPVLMQPFWWEHINCTKNNEGGGVKTALFGANKENKKVFLSIVIPQFNEDEEKIQPLLRSIRGQIRVNWDEIEIIIVNDGGEDSYPLDPKFLRSYAFPHIEYLHLDKNYGAGLAREVGIGKAQGGYIMFCDADDMLYSVDSLMGITEELHKETYDMLMCDFMREVPEGLQLIQKGLTWMHGKVYRKQWLIENDVHFHQRIRRNEDTYFNSIIAHLNAKIGWVEKPVYVWQRNDQSITQRKDYSKGDAACMVQVANYICLELVNRNLPVGEVVYQTAVSAWFKADKGNRMVAKILKDFIRYWWKETESINEEKKNEMYEFERDRLKAVVPLYRENGNFNKFVKKVLKEKENDAGRIDGADNKTA